MKTFRTIAVLTALITVPASLAFADSVSPGSLATGASAALLGSSPSETALNFAGTPVTATAPADSTAAASFGTPNVTSEDTVEALVSSAATVPIGAIGPDLHCANTGPSCSSANLFAVNGANVLSGTDANMFTFAVNQAGIVSGLDSPRTNFIDSAVSVVAPEPSSFILFGTGLLCAAVIAHRRRTA